VALACLAASTTLQYNWESRRTLVFFGLNRTEISRLVAHELRYLVVVSSEVLFSFGPLRCSAKVGFVCWLVELLFYSILLSLLHYTGARLLATTDLVEVRIWPTNVQHLAGSANPGPYGHIKSCRRCCRADIEDNAIWD